MLPIHLLPDQYIKLGGITTRYWRAGEHGSPLILLHGAGSSVETWCRNIAAFAQHHQVYAFDMVGSGLTDKPIATYSLDYQGQFLHQFVNHFEIQQASFVGHSLGACLALKFALESPARVEKLVLVSSFGLGREINLASRLLMLFPWLIHLSPSTPQNVRRVLKQNVYDLHAIPDEWFEMRAKLYAMPGRKQSFISFLKSNINVRGVRPEIFRPIVNQLGNLQPPTLIFWGKQDAILPVAHASVAAQRIPNAQLHLFDRCGHWAQFEYAQKFNQRVLEFLIYLRLA